MPTTPAKQSSEADIPGIYTSEHLSLNVPVFGDGGRPLPFKYMSTPAYHSPLRHHKRAASSTRRVKETLNARSEYSNSEDDGTAQHRINQYLIKQEIGRGSFGAVHLAVDQYGQEYAVKEFSKSRLRKRAQSNLLRRPSARRRLMMKGTLAAGSGFNSPLHRHSSHEENNSLDLIKEEIAIMKKLNHPNLVSLIEVLDDPEEDSLYMVMEMCKKGVVMQVGLEERADPYDEEQCRCWFRDMILGIEYLHAQGIIHRDIKPDNCLVTDDDVLKIVDFGVSEMFDKEGEMRTAKSAGSPAFMPPELCVAKHGQVSGKAADIWSMGVTLYCLMFGRIPFEKHGMLELYQSIRMDGLEFEKECGDDVKDLLVKLLQKDPEKRISMNELREHPWVTRHGTDPLLPASENVAVIVEEPTDEEVNAAITGNMGHLVTVVRAVKRFKQLLFRRRPELMEGILGSASRIVQPPLSMRPSGLRKTRSQDTHERPRVESALAAEGVHRNMRVPDNLAPSTQIPVETKPNATPSTNTSANESTTATQSSNEFPDFPGKVIHDNMSSRPPISKSSLPINSAPSTSSRPPISVSSLPINSAPSTPTIGKGHAHDPLQDHLFLNIGTGEDMPPATDGAGGYIVSESPSNADVDVYETAYKEEIERIQQQKSGTDGTELGRRPTLYMTRRAENVPTLKDVDIIVDSGRTRDELKASIKLLGKRAAKSVEDRAELHRQKDPEGKEGLLSRGLKNVRGFKDLVDEAREIVREEERRDGKRSDTRSDTWKPRSSSRGGSRSSTPQPGGMTKEGRGSIGGTSRSATPVIEEKESGKA